MEKRDEKRIKCRDAPVISYWKEDKKPTIEPAQSS